MKDVKMASGWKALLSGEFEKPYFEALADFVKTEYHDHQCFPPAGDIFAAFDACPLDQLKVVILGQDPYHGIGQADGLCFSVQDQIKMPPSLINIFREINTDLDKPFPKTGNLERWANQGVLLLNATLTVRAHQAGSHQRKGWEQFTDAVISKIAAQKEHLVFMLWGGSAKKKGRRVNPEDHLILKSGHPSPLSANRGYWFGNKHFSKANAYLESNRKTPVDW